MRKFTKFVATVMVMAMSVAMVGCGNSSKNDNNRADTGKTKLVFAYQSSIAYAPLLVMQDQKLIEEKYSGDVEIEWKLMNNGAEINEGLTSGDIQLGALGVSPAITAIKSGVPCKIFAGISSQPYGILTNQDDIKSLKDITDEDQIAITNINSQPHILLAMAAKSELGDAHALDSKLVVLSNADGYSSMVSGAVQCHMVISPYNFMEEAEDSIHNIEIGEDVWPTGNTFIVGVASTKLYDENPDLYKAVCDAMSEAMTYIEENPEDTAKLLAEGYDAEASDIQAWMTDKASNYTTTLQGVMELGKFMVDEQFLDADKEVKDISEIAFSNVEGN